MKESALVEQIKVYLNTKNAYIEKIWGGGFQSAGIPDLLICYRGLFIGIEVKVGKNKPSDIQKFKIDKINHCGGIAIVVWSLDEVKRLFDWIDTLELPSFERTFKTY